MDNECSASEITVKRYCHVFVCLSTLALGVSDICFEQELGKSIVIIDGWSCDSQVEGL